MSKITLLILCAGLLACQAPLPTPDNRPTVRLQEPAHAPHQEWPPEVPPGEVDYETSRRVHQQLAAYDPSIRAVMCFSTPGVPGDHDCRKIVGSHFSNERITATQPN